MPRRVHPKCVIGGPFGLGMPFETGYRQERRSIRTMMIKGLAILGLVAMLATASDAFAFGGGGSKSSGFAAGSASTVSAASSGNHGGGGGGPVTAPEPLAGLAVGLGLLGARFLRRK